MENTLTTTTTAWIEPPVPTGKPGERRGGGMTATGLTNTELGDAVERALQQAFGYEDAHPGRRQGAFDLRVGNDVFEVKAVTTAACEYKAKPKKAEVAGKLAYAAERGLNPHVMIVVYDEAEQQIHAYAKAGVGAYRLTGPHAGWAYIGTAAIDFNDTHE
jgi:hypothetical protein